MAQPTEAFPVTAAIEATRPAIDELIDVTKEAATGRVFEGPMLALSTLVPIRGQEYSHFATETYMSGDYSDDPDEVLRFSPQICIKLLPHDATERDDPDEGLVTRVTFAPFGLSAHYTELDDMPIPPLIPTEYGVWYGGFTEDDGGQALGSGLLGQPVEQKDAGKVAVETLHAISNTMHALGFEAVRDLYVSHVDTTNS